MGSIYVYLILCRFRYLKLAHWFFNECNLIFQLLTWYFWESLGINITMKVLNKTFFHRFYTQAHLLLRPSSSSIHSNVRCWSIFIESYTWNGKKRFTLPQLSGIYHWHRPFDKWWRIHVDLAVMDRWRSGGSFVDDFVWKVNENSILTFAHVAWSAHDTRNITFFIKSISYEKQIKLSWNWN